MKLSSLLKNTDIIRASIDLGTEIKDIKYHSDKVEKGDVFVAIKGNSTNGYFFIDSALEKGAVCVICETVPKDNDVPFVVVRDARKALAEMSKEFFGRPDEKLRMAGVTGTNGKTSTTYFIKEILESIYPSQVGLIGTNQNLVGGKPYVSTNTTPQSYDVYKLLREMCDAGCKYCVMEVSSHAMEQHRVHGIHFEAAVFTNFSQDHLDFHTNMENYKNAKRKLFEQADYCVINIDDGTFNDLVKDGRHRTLTYSAMSENADLSAKNIATKGYKVEFEAAAKDSVTRISVPVPGLFTVYNSLAAAGCALIFGIGLSDIALALKTAKSVIGRYERVECGKPFDVIIDYAHTPEGMESVLSMTRQITKGRVITVFGCGGDRDKTKRPKMGRAAVKYSDICIITSDNSRSENPLQIAYDTLKGAKDAESCTVNMIQERKDAILYAMSLAKEGDTVILLGKGHELYLDRGGKKEYFNERDIVKNA